MSTKPEKAPAPPEVEKILKALEPHAISEECLYLPYARLDPWQLADLAKFFGPDEYWRLFRCVCRRLRPGRGREKV
jgi:hypothetical protein